MGWGAGMGWGAAGMGSDGGRDRRASASVGCDPESVHLQRTIDQTEPKPNIEQVLGAAPAQSVRMRLH